MPDYRRANVTGGTCFFTVTTHRRQPLLTQDDVRHALREGIRKAKERFPFKIDAWVLLPDHLHCIWTLPEGDADFSARWGVIKRYVSQQCAARYCHPQRLSASRSRRKEAGLWQRRFWEHQIRDEVDYQRHVDYIHWNPVKHGHAQHVKDWSYSTFHRFVKEGYYPLDWGGGEAQLDMNSSFGE